MAFLFNMEVILDLIITIFNAEIEITYSPFKIIRIPKLERFLKRFNIPISLTECKSVHSIDISHI